MVAVLPEASPSAFIIVYAISLLPVLVIIGFEIAERVVAKLDNRTPHKVIRPLIALACIAWIAIGFMISNPIANYFHDSSFHSQIEKELEVKNLVHKNGEDIDFCTRELNSEKTVDVKWTERKTSYEGTLTIGPNGSNSCVYELQEK